MPDLKTNQISFMEQISLPESICQLEYLDMAKDRLSEETLLTLLCRSSKSLRVLRLSR